MFFVIHFRSYLNSFFKPLTPHSAERTYYLIRKTRLSAKAATTLADRRVYVIQIMVLLACVLACLLACLLANKNVETSKV